MSLAALLHAHRVKLSLEDAHGLPHGHMTRIRGLLAQRSPSDGSAARPASRSCATCRPPDTASGGTV